MTERGRGSLHRDAATPGDRPEHARLGRRRAGGPHRRDDRSRPVAPPRHGAPASAGAAPTHVETLDGHGRHRWWPMAPLARVEVELERPALRWSGTGYLDANAGDEPLEAAFVDWDWCRGPLGREAAVLYDVRRRDGSEHAAGPALPARRQRRASGAAAADGPARTRCWRVRRRTQSEAGQPASVRQTLEDTPFYARSVVDTRLLGRTVTTMHESLDLDRFSAGWVRMLLPFRMPRRALSARRAAGSAAARRRSRPPPRTPAAARRDPGRCRSRLRPQLASHGLRPRPAPAGARRARAARSCGQRGDRSSSLETVGASSAGAAITASSRNCAAGRGASTCARPEAAAPTKARTSNRSLRRPGTTVRASETESSPWRASSAPISA